MVGWLSSATGISEISGICRLGGLGQKPFLSAAGGALPLDELSALHQKFGGDASATRRRTWATWAGKKFFGWFFMVFPWFFSMENWRVRGLEIWVGLNIERNVDGWENHFPQKKPMAITGWYRHWKSHSRCFFLNQPMALPPRFGPINPCHRGLEVEAPSLPWFLVNFRPENYDIRYPREYLLVPRLAKAIFFPFIFMRSQGLGPHADLCQRWIDFPSQERSNPSTRATGAIFEVGSDWWSPHVPPTHVWGLSPKNTVVIVKLLDYNGLYIYTHIFCICMHI